ncbi:MAG: FMN-dependent NADH-azoreductase [Armatimonadota bacterium]
MARLLHVLAHPEPDNSRTGRIASAFLRHYAELHPEDDILPLDLYNQQIPFISSDHLAAFRKHRMPEAMTDRERLAWEEVTAHVRQFSEADKYLVTAPLWNFTVPAILKAYLDLIVVAGQTFRYDPSGVPVGLLTGRRMALVTTCGGACSAPAAIGGEMSIRYLRAIFGFIGIEVVGELVAEGTNLLPADEAEKALDEIIARARTLAAEL